MKKRINRQAQFQLPFGMIFSVFLIVVFIIVAIIAINSFLDIGKNVNENVFLEELQTEITNLWRQSGSGEYIFEKKLSSSITHICFYDINAGKSGEFQDFADEFRKSIDDEGKVHNTYFYPQDKAEVKSRTIEHINFDVFDSNPYCIEKEDGEIKIKLEKGFEALVRVSAW